MTDVQKGIAGIVLSILLLAGSIVAVRIAYGANDNPYSVTIGFDRAGQGLNKGSDVTLRGVPIGEVGVIDLVDRRVEIRLDINGDRQIPSSATAVIRPKTLFGEKEVALDFDPGTDGPFVENGGRLPDGAGRAGTEVEGLIDSTEYLLERIDSEQLATIINELSKATDGQGEAIRRQFDSGVKLSALFADTIDAQLVALDGTVELTGHFAALGDDLNALSTEVNRGLPILNAAFEDYQRFLATVPPFARELATLLATARPNIERMLDEGDNIMRVLLARQPELEETLKGLADYLYVFANGVGNETFDDGSRFVYFVAFAAMQDINDLVCALVGASPVPEIGQILTSLQGSGFDCSAVSAQPAADPAATPASAGSTPADQTPPPLPEPGQRLLDETALDISTADQPVPTDIDGLIRSWLGDNDV